MNLAERKKKLRQTGLWCSLEISSEILVVIVVFLLAVIMISTPAPRFSSVPLARTPHAIDMPGADQENAIRIGLFRDGSTFIGQDKVTVNQISSQIQELIRTGSERKAYIEVDARTKYGNVMDVIDAVHDAGVEEIGFITERAPRGRTALTSCQSSKHDHPVSN